MHLQETLALFDDLRIIPPIETKEGDPDMYYLRDKDGFAKAVLEDSIVQKIMAGEAGEFGERKLDSGEHVLVYRITTEGGTISVQGIVLFLHVGDYLRRG